MTTNAPQQTIEYARTSSGTLFAIERIRADAWDPAYLDPPTRDLADARIVELPARPEGVEDAPAWLRIETTSHRVAEAAPAYGTFERDRTTTLWEASPYFTGEAIPIDDYIRAAATAILTPAPAPSEVARAALTTRRFAATSPLLAPFVTFESDARERWLQRTFPDAETLAYDVLLERLTHDAPEVATTLRYLRDATIDSSTAEHLDLAFDRVALLEQASPWRYYDAPDEFAHAITAAHAWIRRYRPAYDRHYHAVARSARTTARELATVEVAANALRQLNTIPAIGQAAGVTALREFESAVEQLRALPSAPNDEAARTSNITLGARFIAIDDAKTAASAIHAALEVQRSSLAQHTAHLVLDQNEVSALDRWLDVLTVTNIDGIERVLDPRLAAHIEQLIA